jgi:hypothetical protein
MRFKLLKGLSFKEGCNRKYLFYFSRELVFLKGEIEFGIYKEGSKLRSLLIKLFRWFNFKGF